MDKIVGRHIVKLLPRRKWYLSKNCQIPWAKLLGITGKLWPVTLGFSMLLSLRTVVNFVNNSTINVINWDWGSLGVELAEVDIWGRTPVGIVGEVIGLVVGDRVGVTDWTVWFDRISRRGSSISVLTLALKVSFSRTSRCSLSRSCAWIDLSKEESWLDNAPRIAVSSKGGEVGGCPLELCSSQSSAMVHQFKILELWGNKWQSSARLCPVSWFWNFR